MAIENACAGTAVRNKRRAPAFGKLLAECTTCGATVLTTKDGQKARKHPRGGWTS